MTSVWRQGLGAIFVSLSFLVLPQLAQAQTSTYSDIQEVGIIFAGICDDARPDSGEDPCTCRGQGQCTLANVLQVFVNIGTFILGICGSFLLLIFFYGGFEWLTSLGRPDRVEKGKNAMTGAAIGLVIIFGAYVAITFIISALNSGTAPDSGDTLEGVINQGSSTVDINADSVKETE